MAPTPEEVKDIEVTPPEEKAPVAPKPEEKPKDKEAEAAAQAGQLGPDNAKTPGAR